MFAVVACAPQSRMGMIVDRSTGLQFGSTIEKNIVIDPMQFENCRIKLRLRNTSGQTNFDIKQFRRKLLSAFSSTGYEVNSNDEFGILIDVNVMFAGQISTNLSKEFAFLGGAGGGLAVGSGGLATAGAVIGGAALGAIVGTYVTEDTYIIISEVTIGVVDQRRGKIEETLVFGASKRKIKVRRSAFKGFEHRVRTKIAVYAGGTSISPHRIAREVNQRLVNIIGDVI
jgi:hypothetical protein